MVTWGDALKAFRAMSYRHGENWKMCVVCENAVQINAMMDDARRIFEASSMKLEEISFSRHTITTERGSTIKFVGKYYPEYVKGLEFTQMAFAAPVEDKLRAEFATRMRSNAVPETDLRIDEVSF